LPFDIEHGYDIDACGRINSFERPNAYPPLNNKRAEIAVRDEQRISEGAKPRSGRHACRPSTDKQHNGCEKRKDRDRPRRRGFDNNDVMTRAFDLVDRVANIK
jgi:hypothetical protein